MIYELRTYVVADERIPELLSRFEDIFFPIFERSNIKVISFWTKKDVNELVYVCEFESETAKEVAWETFLVDPEWIALRDRPDPKGPIVTKITSETLIPVPLPSTAT